LLVVFFSPLANQRWNQSPMPRNWQPRACFGDLVGLAMAVWSLAVLKVHRQPSTGLLPVPAALDKSARGRVWRKWLGLMLTYAVLALIYWMLPIYRNAFYKPFFVAIHDLLPALVVFSWFYIRWIDRRQTASEQQADPCHLLGQWALSATSRYKNWRFERMMSPPQWLADYSRAWLVKAFFIPLMFGFCVKASTPLPAGE